MRKKVLIRGPVLTQSGYGEHCRFLLRSLRKYEDTIDLYIITTGWGRTNWQFEETEERIWIDKLIRKTINYIGENKGPVDVSIQVTIPNEWEKLAPFNIGVTAGIETDRVSRVWLEKTQIMDKIIVVSEHAKNGFVKTKCEMVDQRTSTTIKDWGCTVPVEVVHYPVKKIGKVNIDLDLKYDFNFLTVAQWGPRKNIKNTIKWFFEEFKNDEIGLVVKTNLAKNCILDRLTIKNKINSIVHKFPEAKCKVSLLHGYMTEEEMNGLYTHPKIKALVSLTHGEGFGLPLFEAAYNCLPVIATNWSGHLDFLYKKTKQKNGKIKNKHMFSRISYTLQPVQKEAVWEGVIQPDSMWAYPEDGSVRMNLEEMYKDHGRFKKRAKELQKWICKEFTEEKKYAELVSLINNEDHMISDEEIEKIFKQVSAG